MQETNSSRSKKLCVPVFYGACSMQETGSSRSKKLYVPVSWSLFYAEGSLQSKKPWVTVS
jgi:hypothetical protein